MKKLFSLVAIFLIAAIPLMSATYYVDSELGNDNNSGTSSSSPWKTISKVNSKSFSQGDQILFKRGAAWYETLNINYNGILVGSYGTGNLPVIDGQMTNTYNIYLSSKSNVTIQELKLMNNSGSGNIRIKYGTNVTVKNCEFYVTGHGGIFIENSTSSILSGNKMTTPSFINAQTDGIYSQRNNGNIYENNYIVISNTAADQHNDGIQCYMDTDIIARNNYIEQDNFKTGNAQGIYATTSYGVHTWYNNVINTPNTQANSLGFRNLTTVGAYVIIYHNTVITKGGNAVRISEAPDAVVKNNVLITNGTAYPVRIENTISSFDNINYNMYYTKGTSPSCIYLDAYGGTHTLAQLKSRGAELNGYFANPQLTAEFKLGSTSPAIDKAKFLGGIFEFDKANICRPQGQGTDIGAYELPSGPPPPPIIIADIPIQAMDGVISGGGLLTVEGSVSPKVVYLDNRNSSLTLTVTIPSATLWSVKGRFRYSGKANNFEISIDNGPKLTFSNSRTLDQWYWGNLVNAGILSAGVHTIKITNNRPGTAAVIDMITFTLQNDGASQVQNTSGNGENVSELGNYPNPFNPETKIRFVLHNSEKVNLSVYDILGNLVEEITDAPMTAGEHEFNFNGSKLASGVYIIHLRTESFVRSVKMNLLK